MGRANLPTRSVGPKFVRPGDVVLLKAPHVRGSRWMIVDYATPRFIGAPYVWSGRWAFGPDAGQSTTQRAVRSSYTVKHRNDAARDRARVAALRARAQV